MRKHITLLAALALLLSLCVLTIAQGEGGFEGFDVEIIGDPEATDAPAAPEETLAVTVGAWSVYDSWNGEADDSCIWAVLDVQVMNWTTTTVNLADAFSAELTFRGRYTYTAETEFPVAALGMLERIDGRLIFRIPLIVAQAPAENVTVTIHSKDQNIIVPADLAESVAALGLESWDYNYDHAEAGGYEVVMGEPWMAYEHNGVQDDVSLWLLQPLQIVNWSETPVALDESAFTGTLVYLGRYAFNGLLEFDRTELIPLQTAGALLAVRVPLVVTEATAGEVKLNVVSPAGTVARELDMSGIGMLQGYYTVESVDGATYGFRLCDDGWYESTNQGVHSSYSICVVRFRSMSGHVVLSYNNSGESGYDYGMVSPLDTMLQLDNYSDGAAQTFRNENSFIWIDVPDTEEHFICIKYRKDGSSHGGSDSLRFMISGLDAVRNATSSYTVEPVTGAAYGFARNADGWYESTNGWQNSSYAICVVRFRTNTGFITIEYTNSGESGCDFGMVSSLDSMLELNTSSSGAAQTFSNGTSTITIPVPDNEEHFICLKYRKDGSISSGSDSLAFRIVGFD